MSDAPQEADSGPTRDAETGRYVQRHGAPEDSPAEASAPAEAPAAAPAASADTPAAAPAAAADKDTGTPPATQSGGAATPPATPPPAEPGEEKDGRKRWMLLLLLLLILLALLCAGFSYMTWWRKDEPKTAQPSPTATSTAGNTRPSPSPSLTSTPNTSPSPSPAAKMVNMPNVTGMPAADAKVILEGAGFTSIKFVAGADPNTGLTVLNSYTVTKQSVPAGTQVPADTAIVITCQTTSNGKG